MDINLILEGKATNEDMETLHALGYEFVVEKRKKIKNIILWAITYTMFLTFWLMLMVVEHNALSYTLLFVSLGWLLVFSNVNAERWEK
jgi:hypothetical protein